MATCRCSFVVVCVLLLLCLVVNTLLSHNDDREQRVVVAGGLVAGTTLVVPLAGVGHGAALYVYLQHVEHEYTTAFYGAVPAGSIAWHVHQSASLPDGLWRVTVVQVNRMLRGEVSNASLLDDIVALGVPHFADAQPFMDWAVRVAGVHHWHHVAAPLAEPPIQRCNGALPIDGYWRRVDESNATSAGAWAFQPLHCRWQPLSSEETRACLRRRPLVLIGDSRMGGLLHSLARFVSREEGLLYRAGGSVLHQPKGSGLARLVFTAHADVIREVLVNKGHHLVLNSLLHDLATLDTDALVSEHREWDPAFCPQCPNATQTLQACGCDASKPFAIQRYLLGVHRLKELVLSAAAERQRLFPNEVAPPRVFWLSFNKMPLIQDTPVEQLHPWQTTDLLWALEERAAHELTRDNDVFRHIDARSHAIAGPSFWKDAAHYHNFMMFFTVQLLVQDVCVT